MGAVAPNKLPKTSESAVLKKGGKVAGKLATRGYGKVR